MPELSTDVRYIKGVGEQRAKALARLGVHTLGDLLNYFPRAYEDRTAVRPIAELALDETACVRAMVAAEPRLTRVRRGLDLVKLRIVDESGSADVTFFNQSYVRDQLVPGESYVFYGKAGGNLLRKTFTNPVFEREDRAGTVTGRILPLYRLTHGISNKLVVSAVECALNACGDMLPELLPAEIAEQYALPKVGFAYRNVHFPPDWETLALARRRLTFEEFFVLSCATQRLRAQRESVPGERIPTPDVKEFYAALPFSPTKAQRRAADEALRERYAQTVKGLNHTSSNVLGMAAAQAAYTDGDAWHEGLISVIEGNYTRLAERLKAAAPELTLCALEGTFLPLLDLRALVAPEDTKAFMVQKCRVAVDYGEQFGEHFKGFIRLNIGCPRAQLNAALERMKDVLR